MAGLIERRFSGDIAAPADARAFVTSALGQLTGNAVAFPLRDDLELVVSELVTNAVRAGSAEVEVGVGLQGRRVHVQVGDDAAGWPEPRDAGIHDVNGRGLALVSAICAAWGVRLPTSGTGGKVVWAEIELGVAS